LIELNSIGNQPEASPVRRFARSTLKLSLGQFPRRVSPSSTGRAYFMPPQFYDRISHLSWLKRSHGSFQKRRSPPPASNTSLASLQDVLQPRPTLQKYYITNHLASLLKAPRSPMQRSHRPRLNPLSWATRPLLWTVSRRSLPVRPWRSLHPCNL